MLLVSVTTGRLVPALLAFALSAKIVGCSGVTDAERQAHEAAEARTRAERIEAEFQRCSANLARIESEAQARHSMCLNSIAEHKFCLAENEKQAAASGLAGCFLGLVAGVLSGGTAMPWALGGCGAGMAVGSAGQDVCPAPQCTDTEEAATASVLADRGIPRMPQCGGYLGVQLEQSFGETSRGVDVVRVLAGSFAERVRIQVGDVLISVNGMPASTPEQAAAAMSGVEEGSAMRVALVRQGTWLELSGTASAVEAGGRPLVGVELSPRSVESERYANGVRVANVVPDSPAASVLKVGDLIEGAILPAGLRREVLARPVRRIAGFMDLMREARPNEQITLTVARGGTATEVAVELAAPASAP